MEDPNKDYLSNYRSFFESLLKSVDLDYPLPVKVANYNLTEHEIAGEITTWCLQYLNERDCPTSLASILCRRVLEEISRIEPELCGYRPQEQVYHPLKLMQETIRKLAEVCTVYTDNARLSELPPPPTSILYDPIISMYGIKNGRRTMEDRHIAIQDLHRLFNVKNAVGPASYYAVFDGHNGCDAATYANCHLHHYLVQSQHYPHNPEAALREAFTTTDKRFIEKTAKGSSESGTTAVCALIRPEESMLYLAWLGDSQAILVSRGGAYQLVKPHRPDQPDEMKRIIQMGGSVLYVGTWRVDGNLAVSRAIGDKMYKPYIVSEPDIKAVPLTGKEDYLVLASDGLWDFLSEKMVVHAVDSYLAENKGVAGGVSKHLVQLAKKQLSRDNISCITIFLRDPSELVDNKDCSTSSMEVHDLEQPASVVDQLWMRHPNEAVGGKHNGRMDEDDMGPETDVDSVDDVLLSPSIAAAKAMVSQAQANTTTTTSSVWPQERLQKEQQIWLQTLPWSYADVVRNSVPKKPTVQEDTKVPMLAQPETPVVPPLPVQHEPQLVVDNTKELKEKQEEEELVQKILQDPAVVTKGEEIKNYVGDNDVDSGEESEEEWNYIPGKENPKETQKQIQQIQQELNVDEEDMESQLNPNAAEFVPVFIPPSSAAAIEQDLSSSPAKGAEQSLENIDVPSVKEFYTEISKRPSELESLNEDTNISFNETTLNGVNTTGISTKAVYGDDDTLNFLSNSTVPNVGEEDDEAIEIAVPLNDTNPFSPTHVATEPVIGNSADTIQEQMVQDHFSLGFKPFDPMTQSVMEDEGQHEDETSPDIDFMSSGKPDLLSPETNQAPLGGAEVNEALEAQTSSSGFDSESGPDDGDHIPAEQCNLAAAAAAVGISFGEDINIDDIVNNTKSMSLIDDSHPIEKIEQTISPSISPMPVLTVKEDIEEKEIDELKADLEVKEEVVIKVLTEVQDVKSTSPEESPIASKADETLLQFINEEISTPAANDVEPFDIPVHTISSSIEENDKVTVEEILIKGVTPRQLVDLVQELQFNQVNKNKEDEPESDSGFEIINASEASNEPDLIESEITSRLQAVEGSVEPNYVPDLLLQPTESETDRQPSPVGTGTGDIVADIEGAMLDSTPPMEQTLPEKCPLESVESKVKEQKLEEIKSSLLFEEEKVTDEHLELRKSPLLDHLEKEELVKPTLEVDDHMQVILEKSIPEIEVREQIKESQSSVFEEPNERPLAHKEQIAKSSTVDETKEVIKETISVEEDKCTEMGESPIVEDVGSKSSFENNTEEKIVERTLITESAVPCEEIKEQLVSVDIDKEEIKEQLLPEPEAKEEIKEQPLLEPQAKEEIKEQPVSEPQAKEEICEFKEEIKKLEALVEIESKLIEEKKEILLVVDEDRVKCEEVLPSQPTPPTTPAPGVTQQGNEQELIAAAIAAAGVAVAGAGAAAVAISVTESPKVEEKIAAVQKKPSGAPIVKKLDTSKTPTVKSSSVTAKSPAKPSALTTAPKKPSTTVGASTKGAKPASTAKPSTASSKPSTPVSKTAPTNRPPSAKPGTPTSKTSTVSAATKSPPKPRTPTSAKSAPTTTAKAPTGMAATKPAKPTSQTTSARPPSVSATKKPEPAAIKKTVSNTTTAMKITAPTAKTSAPSKPTSTSKLSVAKPGSATTTKSLASKAPTATATSTKPSATPASTAKPATKTNITTTTKTMAAKAPVATKTLPASKSTSANSAASKAPVSKTKQAAPTAIKKPPSNDKNIKDATNNKLSAAKQMGPVKKQEVKAKPINETKEIEPLTQEPTVTTTNGHIENGISNEESSPVEIAYPPIVQALN